MHQAKYKNKNKKEFYAKILGRYFPAEGKVIERLPLYPSILFIQKTNFFESIHLLNN